MTFACTGANKKGVSTKEHDKAGMINARLGTEYLRKNMLDEARFKLERSLEQDDTIALAHSSYALLMVRVGKKKLARQHFRKAIKLDKNDPDTLNNFGLFLCDDGDFEDAMEYFERAWSDAFYKTPEIAVANAGVCLASSGKIPEGIKMVQNAIDSNPNYADGYRQLAHLYFKDNNVKEAKKQLDKYHDRFGYSMSSLLLGINIARQLGDRKIAADYLGLMGRKFPSSQEYRQALDDLTENPIR